MSSDFKSKKLREVIELVIDNRGRNPKEYSSTGIPVIDNYLITSDGQVNLKEVNRFIDEQTYNTFLRKYVQYGDVLMTLVGNGYGKVAITPKEQCAIIQNTVGFRCNNENSNKFLYYLLRDNREIFMNLNRGAAQPSIKVGDILDLEFQFPSKENQENISNILGVLDDRIALLRETNTTLEAIAQALFKSWFVDFDPVHANAAFLENGQAPSLPAEIQALFPSRLVESPQGLIPEGWEWSTIGDVCEFQNGYAFKSNEMSKNSEDTFKIFKMGNIKKGGGLNRSGTKDFYEKSKAHSLGRYLIKKGDLLMCMTDMKNNVALLGHTALMDNSDEFLLNQRVGLLRTKNVNILSYPFLYILTNSAAFLDDLRARANSGVQVNLSTSEIKATSFLLPPKAIHAQFNELVEQLFESMFANDQKQECLIELRDTLLPRLISGQLRLPEAEAALADID